MSTQQSWHTTCNKKITSKLNANKEKTNGQHATVSNP